MRPENSRETAHTRKTGPARTQIPYLTPVFYSDGLFSED